MAFRRTLAHRFLCLAKIRPAVSHRRIPPGSGEDPRTLAHRFLCLAKIRPALSPRRIPPGSGEDPRMLRRILQHRPIFQSADMPAIPQRLAGLGGGRGRIEGMTAGITAEEEGSEGFADGGRWRLRATVRSCVPYAEFLQVCCEVSSREQGTGIDKSLDESGIVVVMGNAVFLRPDQEIH